MARQLTWALLTAAAPQRLRQAMADGPDDPPWELVLGTAGVHAIVDAEPGSEHSGERELALELSRSSRCHVGYADPPWISTCEGGVWVREEAGDIFALAQELGCPLAAARAPAAPSAMSVLRADGATPHALAQALDDVEDDPAVQVQATEAGAVACASTDTLFEWGATVSDRLDTRVYAARVLPEGGLRCQVFDRGLIAGLYDTPCTRWSEGRRLSDILGATAAEDVLRALGWRPAQAPPA